MADSREYGQKKRIQVGTVASPTALDSAAEIFTGGVLNRFDIYRVGFLVTTSATDPASGEFTLLLRKETPLGASPATFATLTYTVPDAPAIGDVYWADVIVPVAQASGDDTLTGGTTPQTSLIDVAPSGPMTVEPGNAYVLEISNQLATGDGIVIVEGIEFDESRPTGTYDQGATDVIVRINV